MTLHPQHAFPLLALAALLCGPAATAAEPGPALILQSGVGTAPAPATAVLEPSATPPDVPPHSKYLRAFQERLGQLGPALAEDPQAAPFDAVAASALRAPERAPGTARLLRSVSYDATGSISAVAEPSVGSRGALVFESFNWFASLSTDHGQTRGFVDPYTRFPTTGAFAAGFCCDQRVVHSSGGQGTVFWYLQYNKTGATSSATNGVRLAALVPGSSTNWWYWDFTRADFGRTGVWLDFPYMQLSANFLYFTSNLFTTTNDTFAGSVIVRIPLAQLQSGQGFNYRYVLQADVGSVIPVHGAHAVGSRPGSTTMYFGAVRGTSSMNLITWPEASTSLTSRTITGLAASSSSFSCPGPDGGNPCGRASLRMQSAWLTNSQVGFAWNSGSVGAARPYPFIRVALFNRSNLALVSQPDIFNTTAAWLYPAFAVNEAGHLGGVIDLLGGTAHPTVTFTLWDDLTPPPPGNGWEIYGAGSSNAGAHNQWGDYNGSIPHAPHPRTWLGAGRTRHLVNGFPNNRIRSIWFGRERDTHKAVQVAKVGNGSGTVLSSPGGIACGTVCSVLFGLGTTVTLQPAPAPDSMFVGWRNTCPLAGAGPCTFQHAGPRTITAEFRHVDTIFHDGFQP